MLSRQFPYGRLFKVDDQEIYQIESLMFFDFLNTIYLLSEEHPDCFGHGAQAILDGLYGYYKELLFGERELDQEEFELKLTQQFVYMTNDQKELRIDLYRHLDVSKSGIGKDFIGGLFHVFNHFHGLQFSGKNELIQLHEGFLFNLIRDILFNHLPEEKKISRAGETYEAHYQYYTRRF
ncbi:hypothetical protein Slin_4854 [Spirosoma linguale DSM 74]|uniref:Uncharacterized protein n=2 Tax=Spirosoma TaxID=107 RepID=D2QQQ1_SPILD|nr:hypothetical protein Slin_4854 [Spirosoma linguale DSM 74]